MKYFWSFVLASCTLIAGELQFTSIQSDFTQKVTSPEGNVLEYTGSFYAREDNRALWIYTKPINKKIYFQTGRVLIVEPDLEQVIISALDSTPNLSSLLSKATKIKTNLYEATFGDTTYRIYAQAGLPQYIEYHDKLDNKVTISLTNVSTNLVLDNALFKPQFPTYYDVINQ